MVDASDSLLYKEVFHQAKWVTHDVVFQSFWKEKSDTLDIFEAAGEFFQVDVKPEIESEKLPSEPSSLKKALIAFVFTLSSGLGLSLAAFGRGTASNQCS